MKRSVQTQLLQALAAGRPVSGAALAEQMGMTRAAVWKHVAALRELGLPIEAQPGRGYCLPWPIELLSEEKIARFLGDLANPRPEVHWQLDSTQTELARREPQLSDLAVVLCEAQQAGRGRRGRTWFSPPGLNICLSCLKRFENGFAALSGLPLAVGVCVIQALEDMNVMTAGLKWPNDIVTDAGKLGGVLIDLHGEYEGPCSARVGVGLNIRLPGLAPGDARGPVTDLATLMGAQMPGRNALAAALIKRIRKGLLRFEMEGLSAFTEDFAQRDVLYGKPLQLEGTDTVTGIGDGIDAEGALRVRTGDKIIRVQGGETSVRWWQSP